MVDRVKYFLLGLLFLLVAGVIAYDRWNSPAPPSPQGENSAHADVDNAKPPPIDIPHDPKPEPTEDPVEPESRPEFEPEPKPKPVAPKPEPEPEAKTQPRIHIVKSGDNLERISLKYYDTRAGVAWIVAANGLKNRNVIFKNQKLIIPARKGGKVDPRKKSPPKKIPSRYTVKSGDGNLYAICRRFYGASGQGARVARVMALNKIWSAEVKAGTVLRLPPK